MKVVFVTEMGFIGKVDRTHLNMRTEFAWMCALNADHYHFERVDSMSTYDLAIVIIPKKNIERWATSGIIKKLKQYCDKVAVMQEGPHWFFQDYPMHEQIWYYNTLVESDIIYVHNSKDKTYYEGLTGHQDIRVLPSLMIEDTVKVMPQTVREGVVIGGNFVSWYNGFDSYIVANEIEEVVHAPSMGRRQPGEEHLLKHLPYLSWTEWIYTLNKFKYGVHLMRTFAAGTFALNCAYLGIPCIGYEGLDTQEVCHPKLTVKVGDLITAKKLMKQLKEDTSFYLEQSETAKAGYRSRFSEQVFLSNFNSYL